MSGEDYEIGKQAAFDHISAPDMVSRTETRSRKTNPFEGPERQYAVEMIKRMAVGDETGWLLFINDSPRRYTVLR